jgi:hypothetical protein
MFARYFRQRAIKSYQRQLLFLLRLDHRAIEVEEHYTADQIIDTLNRYRLSVRFECYAVAIYVSEEAYEVARTRRGWVNNYANTRAEIDSLIPEVSKEARPGTMVWAYTATDGASTDACHGHHGGDCGHGGS